MRVGLLHLGQSVLLDVSITFLRSAVFAIFGHDSLTPQTRFRHATSSRIRVRPFDPATLSHRWRLAARQKAAYRFFKCTRGMRRFSSGQWLPTVLCAVLRGHAGAGEDPGGGGMGCGFVSRLAGCADRLHGAWELLLARQPEGWSLALRTLAFSGGRRGIAHLHLMHVWARSVAAGLVLVAHDQILADRGYLHAHHLIATKRTNCVGCGASPKIHSSNGTPLSCSRVLSRG